MARRVSDPHGDRGHQTDAQQQRRDLPPLGQAALGEFARQHLQQPHVAEGPGGDSGERRRYRAVDARLERGAERSADGDAERRGGGEAEPEPEPRPRREASRLLQRGAEREAGEA